MQFENVYGKAFGVNERGRHSSFESAVTAALKELTTEKNPFYDYLVENWEKLFPDVPAKPGRFEDGKIFLYVRSAPVLFVMRPKLRKIKETLAKLPNAPKTIDLKVEVHSCS